MKKVLLILAMAILTIATTKAQEVRFGVKGGLNLADMRIIEKDGRISTSLDTSFRPSFYVEGLAEFAVVDNFFVETGLQYTNNGTKKVPIHERGVRGEGSSSLNQLTIPVIAKYAVIEGFFLKGGLYAGYLMSGSNSIKSDNKVRTLDINFKEDPINRLNFGLSVGVEYNLPQGVFLEADYNFGIKDLDDSDSGETYTRGIQLGVGYKF